MYGIGSELDGCLLERLPYYETEIDHRPEHSGKYANQQALPEILPLCIRRGWILSAAGHREEYYARQGDSCADRDMDVFRSEKLGRIPYQEGGYRAYHIYQSLHYRDGEGYPQGIDSLAEEQGSHSPDYTESGDDGRDRRVGGIHVENVRYGEGYGYEGA